MDLAPAGVYMISAPIVCSHGSIRMSGAGGKEVSGFPSSDDFGLRRKLSAKFQCSIAGSTSPPTTPW